MEGHNLENRHPTIEEAIKTFSNYLNIKDEPEPSDVIFILGGSTLGPTQKALELYKKGYAPIIAFIAKDGKFSGTNKWGMPEFEMYKRELAKNGVPENAMISEGIGTNTFVEVKAAIPFIKKHGIDPRKIILVSRPFHQRRALATFEGQYPSIKYINCPADEPLDIKDPETKERLVDEAERLLDYAKKGDIKKQEISPSLLRAAVTIRKELKRLGTYQDRRKMQK